MTEVEKRLWRVMRDLDPPIRFRRQHPIGRYIVDFTCPAAKLGIELDGGRHAISQEDDEMRTKEIGDYGYQLIRFWNGDVVENLDGVLETIRRELELTLSAPRGRRGPG